MVNKSETITKETTLHSAEVSQPKKLAKHVIVMLMILVILGGGIWYLYQNPHILSNFKNPQVAENSLTRLENQISILQNQLRGLQTENEDKISRAELESLYQKINNINNINNEILASKASNASIVGLLTRVDELESKTKALGQISSQGALILTAAMLVKDAASQGKPFEYEAEILKQLSMGTNMEASAEKIAQYASTGIVSSNDLIAGFNRLVTQQVKKTSTEIQDKPVVDNTTSATPDWKEKINSKLSELIMIEYHDQDKDGTTKGQAKDRVNQFVNEGKVAAAAVEMANYPAYDTPEFKQWQSLVKANDDFYRALNRIQALTLAVMKAENLKNMQQAAEIHP